MKITLINTDIWRCGPELYCKQGDGQLMHIQSNRNPQILELLEHIRQEGRLDDFCPDGLDRKESGQIIRFLLDNHIIRLEEEEQLLERRVGFFGSDVLYNDFVQAENPKGLNLKWRKIHSKEDFDGLHFLLVVAPVFEHHEELIHLSDIAYKRGIPLLYSELTSTSLTIGPLVYPQERTASLQCYIKRKKVNLKHPDLYAEFIGAADKEALSIVNPHSFLCYDIALGWIRMEMEKALRFQFKLSTSLIEHSYFIDFNSFSIEDSRVLKDPLSPLFQPAHYTPFNG